MKEYSLSGTQIYKQMLGHYKKKKSNTFGYFTTSMWDIKHCFDFMLRKRLFNYYFIESLFILFSSDPFPAVVTSFLNCFKTVDFSLTYC